MGKKLPAVMLVLIAALFITGCSKKANPINQNIKTLANGFQQSMITYFDLKNLQDSTLLINQVNDNMRKVEDSKKKLEQISGLAENLTDEKLRAEVLNFIDLGRERQKLALKYLNDIRLDLDYKYKNPDAQVNINAYIANISNDLLDLEYRSEQSMQRLEKLLTKK